MIYDYVCFVFLTLNAMKSFFGSFATFVSVLHTLILQRKLQAQGFAVQQEMPFSQRSVLFCSVTFRGDHMKKPMQDTTMQYLIESTIDYDKLLIEIYPLCIKSSTRHSESFTQPLGQQDLHIPFTHPIAPA